MGLKSFLNRRAQSGPAARGFYHGWPRAAKPKPKTPQPRISRISRMGNRFRIPLIREIHGKKSSQKCKIRSFSGTDFTDKKNSFPIREIRAIRDKTFAKVAAS
jgi:hypothetical protein